MSNEENEKKLAILAEESAMREEEQSVIMRHVCRLEERVRILHDRLTDVLGPNTLDKADTKSEETSPLCEKIMLIEEFIEVIHNRLEV